MNAGLFDSICYDICGFVFLIFLFIVMIYKMQGKKSMDEKTFIYQVVSSIFFGLSYIFFIVSCLYFPNNVLMIHISAKVYCYALILHEALILTLALFLLQKYSDKFKKKFNRKVVLSIYYIFTTIVPLFLLIFLDVDYHIGSDNIYHISGQSMILSYFFVVLFTIVEFIFLFLIRRKTKEINIFPLLILVILYAFFSRNVFFLNENFAASFLFFSAIDFVLYMTIENKDFLLIDDYNSKKVILESKIQEDNKYMQEVSRKIRTPLFSILGNASYLRDNKINDSLKKQIINDIKKSSDELYDDIIVKKEEIK